MPIVEENHQQNKSAVNQSSRITKTFQQKNNVYKIIADGSTENHVSPQYVADGRINGQT